MEVPVLSVLKAFRRRLTNLSSRNRSLLLTSLPVGQFLDLHETDFLLNKPSFSIIADLIGRKSAIPLCEVLDARQERSNEVSRKLRRIDRTARFIEEERGTEDLYVGWPFVKGKLLDDTVVHGPLLFFPVQIEQQGKFWKLARRSDDFAFLNPTLALAYGQFNQVKLPDEVVEKTLDDFDKDAIAFRTQLYEWLKTTPLEINFNQDLFVDTLHFFNKQTAKDLAQLERTGELKLFPEAVLGIFPQAGSFLVPDYDRLLELGEEDLEKKEEQDYSDNPLTNSPSSQPPSSLPPAVSLPEKFIHTPLPMDASQEAALRAVKAGQSLVVQGPPGTGKSQLIANLMADAAAGGKRVLLVCQKRAALDVVQERLRQVGMAPFLALVHDFQDDRRALYEQIASQINQIDTYRQQNTSLNTVLLERDFDIESRRIDDTLTELQTFKKALFDTSLWGISAKELYLTINPTVPSISLEDSYPQFNMGNVDNYVQKLVDYAAYQQRLGANHLWSDRLSFAEYNNDDLSKISQTLTQWQQTSTLANEQSMQLFGRLLSLEQLFAWKAHDWQLTALLNLLTTPDAAQLWALVTTLRHNENHPALSTTEARINQLIQAWEESLANPGPENSLPTQELRAFRDVLAEARSARSSWVSWQWWQLTKNEKTQLQNVASANELPLTEEGLQTLAVRVEKRIRLEAVRHETTTLLTGLSLAENADSLRMLVRAQQLVERMDDLSVLKQIPSQYWQTSEQFIDVAKHVLTLADKTENQYVTSKAYLSETQLNRIWENATLAEQLRQTLRTDFDLLVEMDRLQAGFSDVESAIIDKLKAHEPANWADIFQTSLRQAWLAQLEALHPELRSVSSLRMAQWEQTLQASIQRKQALSRDILLVKLREQTYRNLAFNRLNNVVTYRDLLHQTTKKRNVWPVRKLMEAFADEVFKLVPCWLASPESVSAMFPLREGLFDVVIFDEASQCFAENGVPAMVRGKQVVVTGDNHQLRPSDIYRIRLDDVNDDEQPTALEVESLLELAAQQLPQISLAEHYRSRSLDLITFSNKHFYSEKLSLLPSFSEINRHEPAIRYLNVTGTWQNNTNPTEADAVLQLLDQITVELPGRTVGIVTFNYPQQQLIQDKLEMNVATIPETLQLFVKNIENVQGDERDIIIFSIGYAPDEHGRISAQFGSLSVNGGQNRLNVAVTRARERIYVVTSLWPEQLNVADTANEGPKLLKDYLAYALNVSQGEFSPKPHLQQALSNTTLLKNKLAELHANWHLELPFADLTVKAEQLYESVILTDDDTYYQQTDKQAHAYLPMALASRGWPFTRMWSREYWRNAT